MSKGNTFENDLLKLIFQNTAIADIGNAAGLQPSGVAGSLFFSLHTADPGEAGSQTTSECAYTGYARVGVVRSAVGFTVTTNSVSPAANIDFPTCTAVPGGAATHCAVGTLTSGAGKILYKGALTPNITIAIGVTPRITTATAITED